ncbi:hypothetical protein IJG79_03145 [Candidatus Saccharibacteria bacterium]|nr:hypothetical protein [Candidatus Saccharibacteria bacterium]
MPKIKIDVQEPGKNSASNASVAPKKATRHIAVTKVGEKTTPSPKKSVKKSVKKSTKKPVAKKTIKVSSPKRKVTVTKPAPAKVAPVKPAPVKPKKIAISRPVQHPISSSSTHRSIIQRSTTLSRRYVKRPTSSSESSNIRVVEVSASEARRQEREALKKARAQKLARLRFIKSQKAPKVLKAPKAPKVPKPVKSNSRPIFKSRPAPKPISKPIAPAKASTPLIRSALKDVKTTEAPQIMRQSIKKKHRGRRIALAIVCSLLVIGGLAAFFYFNMPDISVKVVAMQTGIEASYPSFTPRGYALSNVTSDKDGVITIGFDNSNGSSFTLTEENSTWDSTALLNNYVKKSFPSDYATIREQGITIYYRGGNAAWVNGGILYKINCSGGALTKEQVRNIATSM